MCKLTTAANLYCDIQLFFFIYLEDLEGNTASALLLADAPKSPNYQMTDVPVAVLPTIKPNVKLINEAIKGKGLYTLFFYSDHSFCKL